MWTAPTNLLGHAVGWLLTQRKPRKIQSAFAKAWVYALPRFTGLRLSALTLGHVILVRPDKLEGLVGQLILVHELAHTRQHDLLGPLYLPAHGVCEIISYIVASVRRRDVFSKVHAYNPLEQTFICIGAGACRPLAAATLRAPFNLDAFIAAFGVEDAPAAWGAASSDRCAKVCKDITIP